jgi:hypothetical protein
MMAQVIDVLTGTVYLFDRPGRMEQPAPQIDPHPVAVCGSKIVTGSET